MRRTTSQPTSLKAFTLVELLVVIGIIAVLVSMLLPTLNKVRSQANSVACKSNMKQFGVAFAMYVADNKRYPNFRWPEALNPYIKGTLLADSATVNKLPNTVRDNGGAEDPLLARPQKLIHCPAAPERGGRNNMPVTLTYTMNGLYSDAATMATANAQGWAWQVMVITNDPNGLYQPIKPSRIRGSGGFGLMTEAWNTRDPNQTAWTSTSWRLFVANEMSAQFCHGTTSNVLFADFHVDAISLPGSRPAANWSKDAFTGFWKLSDQNDALFNFDQAAMRSGRAKPSKYIN